MEKRIRLSAIITSLGSLIFFMIICLLWVNETFTNTVIQDLNSFLGSAVYLAEEIPQNGEDFAKGLAKSYSSGVRITIIAPDGTVLGDSDSDFSEMDLHHTRAEVIDAANTGYGSDMRKSETKGINTLYVARSWRDGYIIRAAIAFAPRTEFVKNVLPGFLGSFILVSIAVVFFSKKSAQTLTGNMQKFSDAITNAVNKLTNNEEAVIEDIKAYEEFRPIVEGFQKMADSLYEYINNLNNRQEEIRKILGSMEEGLILLDNDFNILVSNDVGLQVFRVSRLSIEYNITHLFREEVFLNALYSVKETGKSTTFDLNASKNRVYRVHISTVVDGGFVILTSDVSQVKYLEKIRTEFTANVSHELKTPITSISGFAELIDKGMVTDPDKIQEYSHKIYNESQRLIELIGDILKLSEIESMTHCEKEVISAKDAFNSVVEILTPKMQARSVAVNVEGNARFFMRYSHFTELITNLLDNAVKYNKDGGTVDVRIFEDEKKSGFTVKDTGIGIPKEHQARVFERFYRADKGRNGKVEGTGLGLSIVKHIVLSYKGDIQVHSSEQGTEITVEFKKE